MSRHDTIGTHKTTVRTEDTRRIVRYHNTDVVSFDAATIVLNSGGFRTATTKVRMNQTARQFDLGYWVYQSKGQWFVTFKGVDSGVDIPFTDGITLTR